MTKCRAKRQASVSLTLNNRALYMYVHKLRVHFSCSFTAQATGSLGHQSRQRSARSRRPQTLDR